VTYPGTTRTSWYAGAVYRMLTHPKYIGCSVYGQTSHKLYGKYTGVPRPLWTVTKSAFEPLVSEEQFAAAERTLKRRTVCKSNDELLQDLKSLWQEHGKITSDIINAANGVPSTRTYEARFGGLRQAYAQIGYDKLSDVAIDETRRRMRRIRERLITELCEHSDHQLTAIQTDGRLRKNLLLPNRTLVSIYVCPSRPTKHRGAPRWQYQPGKFEGDNVTLIARLKEGNTTIKDIHLLRKGGTTGRFLTHDDPLLSGGVCINSLSQVCDVAMRLLGTAA
jgi:hypothetical protein